jgi:hypothetical protein
MRLPFAGMGMDFAVWIDGCFDRLAFFIET